MLTKRIRITSYDVWPNGTVRLSALQKYMQQLARDDSDQYGATYPRMRETGMVFVITRLVIELDEPLRDMDEIEMATINERVEGVQFIRLFHFSKNGREVGRATTWWALMDFINRRVLRTTELQYPIPALNTGEEALAYERRIWPKDASPDFVRNHIVRYSELDENDHLNNAVYSDLLYDYGGLDWKNRILKRCQINFFGEAALDSTLRMEGKATEHGLLLNVYNTTADKVCFEAQADFT